MPTTRHTDVGPPSIAHTQSTCYRNPRERNDAWARERVGARTCVRARAATCTTSPDSKHEQARGATMRKEQASVNTAEMQPISPPPARLSRPSHAHARAHHRLSGCRHSRRSRRHCGARLPAAPRRPRERSTRAQARARGAACGLCTDGARLPAITGILAAFCPLFPPHPCCRRASEPLTPGVLEFVGSIHF